MYLGIEIGGTKLQLGIGPGDGTLAGLWRGNVDVAAGPEGIRRQITAAVPELLARARLDRSQIKAVGIGFGGPVDDATRTIIKSHQIEGWDNFPLADWITEITGWPAALGNDADVAGLAEALFGAGKGLSPIFYITIGSGIGGGLIINGEIYRGCGRGAAEIGHISLESFYVTDSGCAFGEFVDSVENHASGWGIEKLAADQLWAGKGRDSLLLHMIDGQADLITCENVAEAAGKSDKFSLAILEEAQCSLAKALCHVITLLCPRRIVIGGGVSLMGEELLFEPLRKLVAERVFKPFAGCY